MKKHLGTGIGGIDIYRSEQYMSIYKEMTQRLGQEKVEHELSIARKLFLKYDANRSGYLEQHELIPMIKDTYKLLGKEVSPTQEDIEQYLKMLDLSGDNVVSMEEYEYHILKSLQHRNLHL